MLDKKTLVALDPFTESSTSLAKHLANNRWRHSTFSDGFLRLKRITSWNRPQLMLQHLPPCIFPCKVRKQKDWRSRCWRHQGMWHFSVSRNSCVWVASWRHLELLCHLIKKSTSKRKPQRSHLTLSDVSCFHKAARLSESDVLSRQWDLLIFPSWSRTSIPRLDCGT